MPPSDLAQSASIWSCFAIDVRLGADEDRRLEELDLAVAAGEIVAVRPAHRIPLDLRAE